MIDNNINNNTINDEKLPLAPQRSSYLYTLPQTVYLKPDEQLLTLCPGLDYQDFFNPPSDRTTKQITEEQDALDTSLAQCPKNKLQHYTAPPITDVPWPEKHRFRQQFDHDLQSIQSKLAVFSRRMDKMVMDTLEDDRLGPDQINDSLENVGTLVDGLREISHHVHDLRTQNLEKAHGLNVLSKKTNRTPTYDFSSLLE
ncbi:hypothetical protein BGZ94_003269 [Podila epigama]|nr:hypothetical protein BGZ94_003269 [Podila epigama]